MGRGRSRRIGEEVRPGEEEDRRGGREVGRGGAEERTDLYTVVWRTSWPLLRVSIVRVLLDFK